MSYLPIPSRFLDSKTLIVAIYFLLSPILPPLEAQGFETLTSSKEQRKEVSITVYNNGMGIVRETRSLHLPKGRSVVRFEDVATQILPQTVRIKSSNDKEAFSVYEQNFEYDLISRSRLLEKYVGEEVRLHREVTENGKTREEIVSAKLISNNDVPIFQIGDTISLDFPGRISVKKIPDNLFSKPTLLWKLFNEVPGLKNIDVSYQTNGMNWNADYVMVLDEDESSCDLTSWVTLTNNSGVRLDNATLQLVAGKVQRVSAPRSNPSYIKKSHSVMMAESYVADAPPPEFQQENLSEYYLYTLDTPTNVGENQTKQLKLFGADKITVIKRFLFENIQMGSGDEKTFQNASIRYDFKNETSNSLGRPIPAGIVRVFKADSKGRQQFIGEDSIDHTSNKEELRIKIGQAFDVVGSGKQLSYENFTVKKGHKAEYEFSVRNRKKEDVTVRVYVNTFGEFKISKSSHEFKKESAFRTYFEIPIKAEKEETIKYTYEQYY